MLLQKPARELYQRKAEAGRAISEQSISLDGHAVMVELGLEDGRNEILLKSRTDEFRITVDTRQKKVIMDRSIHWKEIQTVQFV